jgi:glycosyltransferase involved in cell wall biosynthesis
MAELSQSHGRVSAIIPARNEEAMIAACVESLAVQPEIAEILVVDDESKDRTAEIVRELMQQYPRVRLLETGGLPEGWVGKNNAVWRGAREATGEWLLFTDADAVHEPNSATQALATASQNNAAMVSYSPEQVMVKWYEKALIPYVYCRLGKHYSFSEVNDPSKSAAAANGQFLMIRRDVYQSVGGHESVAGEILEDVALAKRVKSAAHRIWFGSGKRIVRVRMYRSYGAMREGWKKNLYPLMGGTEGAVGPEIIRAVGPVMVALIAAISAGGFLESASAAAGTLLLGLVAISIAYDGELSENQFPHRLVWYGIPGRLLFARVLWASYRAYKQGKLKWKGREYPASTPGASNG